jgi:7-cyano-7-deazaguanine synthase
MSGRSDVEHVRLLWTGGWDSSFRLMQLLLIEKRPVQPIYVIDTGRGSLRRELQAMETLRAGILERLEEPSLLAPTQVLIATEYPPSSENVARGESIRSQVPFGSQYIWLTGPAEALGWAGVEMCVPGEAEPAPWEKLLFTVPGRLTDTDEAALLKYWSFPLITLSKEEMREIAREHGFLDLLLQRWSCFDPLLGLPCGRCHPCSLMLHDGVTFAPAPAVRARGAARRVRRVLATARRRAARA